MPSSFRRYFDDFVALILGSTDTGKGASRVGVRDAGDYFDSEELEGVLQEIGAAIDGGAVVDAHTARYTTTASVNRNILAVKGSATYNRGSGEVWAVRCVFNFLAAPAGTNIIAYGGTNASGSWVVYTDTDRKLHLHNAAVADLILTSALTADGSQYVVDFIFSATQVKAFVNGVQDGGTVTTNPNLNVSQAQLVIGRDIAIGTNETPEAKVEIVSVKIYRAGTTPADLDAGTPVFTYTSGVFE